jgi:hypothetical protein
LERISEFCTEVTGCGFSGLAEKCDKIAGTPRLKRKARSKMSTYPNFVAV